MFYLQVCFSPKPSWIQRFFVYKSMMAVIASSRSIRHKQRVCFQLLYSVVALIPLYFLSHNYIAAVRSTNWLYLIIKRHETVAGVIIAGCPRHQPLAMRQALGPSLDLAGYDPSGLVYDFQKLGFLHLKAKTTRKIVIVIRYQRAFITTHSVFYVAVSGPFRGPSPVYVYRRGKA